MNRLLLRALVDPKQDGCPAVNAPPQLSSRLATGADVPHRDRYRRRAGSRRESRV